MKIIYIYLIFILSSSINLIPAEITEKKEKELLPTLEDFRRSIETERQHYKGRDRFKVHEIYASALSLIGLIVIKDDNGEVRYAEDLKEEFDASIFGRVFNGEYSGKLNQLSNDLKS